MERSDLVLLRAQLKFAICLLEFTINLLALSILIGMIICFQDGPLVIILILGWGLSVLLKIVLLTSSIFLFDNSGKFSLIWRMLLMFLDDT